MQSSTHLFVTLVVPIFQSAQTLPKLFNCILEQTIHNFKVIFVYDESKDNSFLQLKEFQSSSGGIKVDILVKPKKEGLGKARDYALDSGLIDTKYVVFVDGDDTFEPSFIAKLFESAEKFGSDVSMCGFDRIDTATNKTISIDMVHNPEVIRDPEKNRSIAFLNNSVWNKLMRVETVGDIRYIYPGGVSEDEMFFLKFIPKCHVISFVNEPLYHYQVSKNGLGLSVNPSSFFATEKAYLDVLGVYKRDPFVYGESLPLLEASIFVHLCVGTVTKIALSDKRQKKRMIKESYHFLQSNFPKWYKSVYLSFFTSLRMGLKTILMWRCKILYRCGCFGLFIFEYKTFLSVFHKDIKW